MNYDSVSGRHPLRGKSVRLDSDVISVWKQTGMDGCVIALGKPASLIAKLCQ